MSYPPCFQRLHDEAGPVGYLGRGTHYSVLRIPTWHDELMNQLQYGRFLDFAIIWDEDHDDRVLDAILIMYLTGLLAPVRFIGERKGVLSVMLAPSTVKTWDNDTFQQYREDIVAVCAHLDDPWTAEINSLDSTQHSIIQAPAENVATYLKNIDMLWQLGTKSTLPA